MMDKIRKDIRDAGVSLIAVGRDSQGPGFMYTIGLVEKHEHPELIIVGVPRDVGKWLLDALASKVKDGKRFMPDLKYVGILEPPYRLAVRDVHRDYFPEYLGTALRYYGKVNFSAEQIFLPDVNDLMPWEEGYEAKVPADLRLLYLPPSSNGALH
jgi:hypothetical protein